MTPAIAPVETPVAGARAVESCKVVVTPGFYPEGHIIDEAYVDR